MDENSQVSARKSKILLVFYMVELSIAIIFIVLLVTRPTTSNSLILLLFGLAFLAVPLLIKYNKISFASSTVMLLCTALILTFVWLHEGLKDETMMVFPAIAAFSLITGSLRLFNWIVVIIILNIITIGLLNSYGIMEHKASNGGMFSATVLIVIFCVITFATKRIALEMVTLIKELTDHKDNLEQKVEERTIALEENLLELKQTHDKLSEAEKFASLGRLVAGISHEINTPIGIAVTASSLASDKIKSTAEKYKNQHLTRREFESAFSDMEKGMQLVSSNLDRASKLIAEFKSASVVTSNEQRQCFDLKEHIDISVGTLKGLLDEHDVEIHVKCRSNISVIQDPNAMSQILINLIVNSIKHAFKQVSTKRIDIIIEVINGYIMMDYLDSGIGLNKEVTEKIFEPFFTTNRNAGGTGLGMHIVYNLITQSLHGDIVIVSTEEKGGAYFRISFPKEPLSNA